MVLLDRGGHRGTMGLRVWAGLATIYVVWGSTYLAIMVAIDTLPPYLMSAVRFLLAGAILYAFSVRRGERELDRPGLREWRAATLTGILLLVVGNGSIAWAEQRVDSGVAALVVATVPLWVALIGWGVLGRRLGWSAIVGLVVGVAGVAILVGPAGDVDPFGGAVIVAALALASEAAFALVQRAGTPGRERRRARPAPTTIPLPHPGGTS